MGGIAAGIVTDEQCQSIFDVTLNRIGQYVTCLGGCGVEVEGEEKRRERSRGHHEKLRLKLS